MPTTAISQQPQPHPPSGCHRHFAASMIHLEILPKPPTDLSSFKTFAGAFFAVPVRCRLHPSHSIRRTHPPSGCHRHFTAYQNTVEILPKPPTDLSSFKTFAGAFFAVAVTCRWHPPPSNHNHTRQKWISRHAHRRIIMRTRPFLTKRSTRV